MGTVSTTVVVMGVSGAGKTTVARALAERRGWRFAEGDTFHSPQHLAQMAAGRPLGDADRAPWLDAIARWVGACEAAGDDAVVSCSALKRAYRDRLRAGHPSVVFLFLDAPRAELERRVAQRPGHFMPPALLASQLDTLEVPGPDEPAFRVSATLEIDRLLAEADAMLPR